MISRRWPDGCQVPAGHRRRLDPGRADLYSTRKQRGTTQCAHAPGRPACLVRWVPGTGLPGSWRLGMSSFAVRREPLAMDVQVSDDEINVSLADGRRVSAPLVWFPRLRGASAAARSNWRLIGDGEGVHWPDADEDTQRRGSPGWCPVGRVCAAHERECLTGRYGRPTRLSRRVRGTRVTPSGGRLNGDVRRALKSECLSLGNVMLACLTALLLGVLGCSLRPSVAIEWFTVAHSSGGPAPGVRSCTFFENGLLELDDGSPTRRWGRLSSRDFRIVRDLVRSREWNDGLAWVKGQGDDWSCCDQETVEIWFAGTAPFYSIPVTDLSSDETAPLALVEKAGATPPGLPPQLKPGFELIDRILRQQFGVSWRGFGSALRRRGAG